MKSGENMGIISEAGCPAVADPAQMWWLLLNRKATGCSTGRPVFYPDGRHGLRLQRTEFRLPRLPAGRRGRAGKETKTA